MNREERSKITYTENEPKPVKRRAKLSGRILGVIGKVLMVCVIFACLSLVIPKIAGYDAYVVVSGSMEPAIPVGSIVYSKKVDSSTLQIGDVIVFIDPSRSTTPITHRVVSNDPSNGTIVTKGDANEREDVNPATYDNVVGKVGWHVPRVGFVAATLTSTLGKIVAGLLLLEAWLLIEISRRLKARR